MREIKFMAWDKEEKEWIQGPPDQLLRVALGYPKAIDLYQFTGLLDKDGKEIYEGHRVSVPYINPKGQVTKEEGYQTTVIFQFGQFCFSRHSPDYPLIEWCDRTKGEYVPNYGETWDLQEKTLLKIIGHIAEEETK